MYKQYKPYQYFLVIADFFLIVAILVIAVKLRPLLPGKTILAADTFADFSHFWPMFLAVPILFHIVFAMTGVYELSRVPFFSLQISRLVSSYLLAVLVAAGFFYFTYREVSRLLVVYFSLITFAAMVAERYLLTLFMAKRATMAERTNVLIVGGTERSIALAERLFQQYGSVYNLVGLVDSGDGFDSALPAPLIGTIEDLPRLVREHDIQLVLIALTRSKYQEVEKLIVDLYPLPVRIYLIPDVLELSLRHSEVETFADVTVIGIREPVIQGAQRAVKRIFDVVVASVALILSSPLWLVIWIAIKMDSPGPAIFKTDRIGENGKIFTMYKFRTMVVGAARLQDKVMALDKDGEPVYKLSVDPRITGVGRWLRRWSLDELPQFINILKGEMSLVGPRPEQAFITQDYDASQWPRLSVPPGLTGWWQVSGRSDLPLHLNTQYDLYYVRNYSFVLDLKIILKTIGVVLRGKGAY
ncbi:MAG: sugar transferase [Desulfomonile tiedjei]|nr:sugar transferase [Desulfomonile tiedjei]